MNLLKLIKTFEKILKQLVLQNSKLKHIEETIMAELAELNSKIAELEAKVDLDVAQGAQVIVAINALLAKIPANVDYQPQIDALNAIIGKVTSDNPAIQAAIDSATSA